MLAGAGAGTGESLGEVMLFHSIFRGLNIRLITEHTEQLALVHALRVWVVGETDY